MAEHNARRGGHRVAIYGQCTAYTPAYVAAGMRARAEENAVINRLTIALFGLHARSDI
jgi:hypothetical protein